MDTKKKNDFFRGTCGLLSLEASISLCVFILLMLVMTSFFVIYEARNEMAHVLLTTADSLALDPFANEMPEEDTIQSILYELYGSRSETSGTFTNSTKWYDGEESVIEETIRNRFFAYLAGGSEEDAKTILGNLNIVGGIDDLDFSASKVENGQLYLEVRYKVEFEFKAFGFDSITLSQSCRSKLWK